MTICSIEIKNLLSFDSLIINDFQDINCIVGKNNTGKSNLLKLIKYFYFVLDGGREAPPELHSNYSSFGSITIEYDTTRIRKIVMAEGGRKNTPYFKHIYNTLFGGFSNFFGFGLFVGATDRTTYKLTLTINSNNSTVWSTKKRAVLDVIRKLYPFFEIQARHIDLYDWNKLWDLVSRLKSFHMDDLKADDVINFFNGKLSQGGNDYKDYVERIKSITQTADYNYNEKVLNYLKAGLDGHSFINDGEDLKRQSDGSNSYRYIEWFLSLMISLTRRDYISPVVYIDEPEIGLHSKLNEQLIKKIHDVHESFKKTTSDYELGRYATPYPKIIISTHSPNILKSTIKLFSRNHRVYHFSKLSGCTEVRKMVSQYTDPRFLNVFSDNEARLFFSDFILFVEGATEVELFRNVKLGNRFEHLERADVYATNDVALGGINPKFSNASIPYLILYDLDSLIAFDYRNRKISLSNKKINIRSYLKDCKYSYYGSKKHFLKKEIQNIIQLSDSGKVVFDRNNIHVESISSTGQGMDELVATLNYKILFNYNYMLTLTTIEGALISDSSFNLFVRWLIYEVKNNLNVCEDRGASKRIKVYGGKTNLTDFNSVVASVGGLLSPCFEPHRFKDPSDEAFVLNLKRAYVGLFRKKFLVEFSTKRDFIVAMRLIFEGKSGSLISLKSEKSAGSNRVLAGAFAAKVDDLGSALVPLKHLIGKTSGWVTSFVNFSIDEIDRLEKKTGRNNIFPQKFPELYAILNRLRPR